MTPLFSLRYSLPAGVAVVLIGLLGWFNLGAYQTEHDQMVTTGQQDALRQVQALARQAQGEPHGPGSRAATELAMAMTDQRALGMALLDPSGRVEIAHRARLAGTEAFETLPGLTRERFLKAQRSSLPDVLLDHAGVRLTVLQSHLEPDPTSGLRNMTRGVVYLAYDLTHDHKLMQHQALRRLGIQSAGVLLLMLLVGAVLRWRVTQPLHRLEHMAQQLALSQTPQVVPEDGPTEVRQLASSFNSMAARIQSAQTELEGSRAHLASIIDSAMDAIITVDSDLRIRVFNPAAAHMFGWSEAEAVEIGRASCWERV